MVFNSILNKRDHNISTATNQFHLFGLQLYFDNIEHLLSPTNNLYFMMFDSFLFKNEIKLFLWHKTQTRQTAYDLVYYYFENNVD